MYDKNSVYIHAEGYLGTRFSRFAYNATFVYPKKIIFIAKTVGVRMRTQNLYLGTTLFCNNSSRRYIAIINHEIL